MSDEEPPAGERSVGFPLWFLFDAERLAGLAVPDFDPVSYSPDGGATHAIPVFTVWGDALDFITSPDDTYPDAFRFPETCPLPLDRAQVEKVLIQIEGGRSGHVPVELDAETIYAKRTTVSGLLAAVRAS